MGSYGYGRKLKKHNVEAVRSIDVRRFAKQGLLANGTTLTWSWFVDGLPVANINVISATEGIWLNYSVQIDGDAPVNIRQFVRTTSTPCNYGGTRKWFHCPGNGCNRRVAILYGAGELFLCRRCYKLTYRSCQTSGDELERMIRRVMKIKQRLGIAQPGLISNSLPDKPPHMHWRTYGNLVKDLKDSERRGLLAALSRMR